MKISKWSLLLFTASLLFLAACGGDSKADATKAESAAEAAAEAGDNAASDMGKAQNDMARAMEELQKQMGTADGEAKEPVNFRELKELLPESLVGLQRKSHTGEKAGAMGFKMSTAEATYEEDSRRLNVKIIDFVGAGMGLMGLAAWSMMDVDRETDTGYERTTKIKGHKAFEQYDQSNESGQVSLIVADRFIVTVEGRGVSDKDLRKALDGVDIDKLAKMKS